MAATGKLAKLDRMFLCCLTRLESVEECCGIEHFLEEDGECSLVDLATWEKKNAPYVLPADLKAFYAQFNGLRLSYRAEIGGKQVKVGEMCLNKLEAITRVALEGTFPKMGWPKSVGAAENKSCRQSDPFVLDLKSSAAFSIDSSLEIGDVVLLYRCLDDSSAGRSKSAAFNPYSDPEVWFQDISARWHFVSASFTNFLRLMVSHLGVYGWQLAYSSEGLPPETIHWMGLFCKERICIDENASKRRQQS